MSWRDELWFVGVLIATKCDSLGPLVIFHTFAKCCVITNYYYVGTGYVSFSSTASHDLRIFTIASIHSPDKRGAETWGFHESPSYPNMYCFLAWRERTEFTHKTHHVGTEIILSIISHFRSCFSWMSVVLMPTVKMKPKIGAISFNEKVISEFLMNHVVLRESRSFPWIT